MKRYLLFGGDHYYPLGGWNDHYGSYLFLSDAIRAAEKLPDVNWWHIVDTESGYIVASK